MTLPLYRPPVPVVSGRRPVPFVSLVCAVAAVALLVSDVVRELSLPRPLVAAAVLGGGGLVVLLGWAESRLRARLRHAKADRAYGRDCEGFEADLRHALERERRELLARSRGPGALILGTGSIDSEVRVVGDAGRLVQEGMPLAVRRAGTIRVLGPPALAIVIADGLVEQVSAAGVEASRWTITVAADERIPRDWLADVWLGPDGSAAVRSRGQAGRDWVPIEPWVP